MIAEYKGQQQSAGHTAGSGYSRGGRHQPSPAAGYTAGRQAGRGEKERERERYIRAKISSLVLSVTNCLQRERKYWVDGSSRFKMQFDLFSL